MNGVVVIVIKINGDEWSYSDCCQGDWLSTVLNINIRIKVNSKVNIMVSIMLKEEKEMEKKKENNIKCKWNCLILNKGI